MYIGRQFLPLLAIIPILLLPVVALSQTKTYSAGAYIIDMGQSTQTIANGLKPYGLVYSLIKAGIPVDWAIDPLKVKDGIDFYAVTTANGNKAYKGGSFIIDVVTYPAALAIINTWKSANPGLVVDGPTTAGFTAPIYKTLTIWPRAFLDSQNDPLITPYYANAGIPSSSFVINANPTMLPQCGSTNGTQDVYILPHADPQIWDAAWVAALQGFINNGGGMWAGCHAVSAMENIPGCNFLSNNGLILWGNHSNGTPPYTYTSFGNPLMQFMGILDGATTNGSEEIYVPGVSGWRASTTIAVYDPNYVNTKTGFTYANTAAIVAYGPAFGNKGLVMYEAGHDLTNGASVAQQVAAQRAFFDFLLLAGGQPQTYVTPPNISNQTASACSGSAFTVTPSGAPANITYTWLAPTGTGFTGGAAQPVPQSTISQTLTNTTTSSVTAVYTVTPRIGGCLGNTFTLTVTLLAPPLLTSTLTPAAICSGTTFSYTATSAATLPAFSWTRAVVSGISNAAGSGSNGNISEILNNTTTAAIVVIYAITTTAYGCSNTQNVTVTVNPLISAPTAVTATPASICTGGSTSLKATSAGNTIRWYTVATGGTSIGSSASGVNFPVTLSTTTTYYAEAVITSSGCSSATRTAITVTVTQLPVLSSSLTATACSATLFSYSATSATTGATFSWTRAVKTGISNPAGSGSTGNISETLINTTTSPVVVTYAITTTANGCSSTQNVLVTVNASPTALSLSGSTICMSPGGNGTITSSTSATGINYQLYNRSGVAQGSALGGTGSGLSWSGLAIGTGYYVIGTNTTTSCTSKSGTVNIGTYTNPAATAISNSPVCTGSPLTLIGGPGSLTTYSWTGPSYSSSSQSPTVSSGATTAMSGTYFLTVTDSHGCQGTASVVATVNAPPDISNLTASGTTTCAGSSVVVTVSSSSLVTGTYTVTYNVTGTNTVATTTASMSFTAGSPGTGTFITSALNTVGPSNIVHITAIAFSSTPLCTSSVSVSTAAFTTQNCIAGTCTYTSNGTYSFTAPAGVTSITIQAWGAGGGSEKFTQGNDAGAGGGGGGAYTTLTYSSVISGTLYTVVVGKGGAPGVAGTNSTFNGSVVVAVGGGSNSTEDCHNCTNSGGIGGQASASTPSGTAFSGGNGGTGGLGGPGKHGGGGGGGSAGSTGNGGSGSNYSGDTGGSGGIAGTGTPGGATGGAGGNHNNDGNNGNSPGAGGGGASHDGSTSGSGADGEVIINYTCPFYSLTSISATSPCIGNAATVTLNGTLPIGTYVVTYSLSGSNTATNFTANLTVTSAGTGTFTTSILANSGSTTVTVTNLSSGSCSVCSSIISINNAANFTVNPNSVGGTSAASSPTICYNNTTNITLSGNTGTIQWQQSPDGSTGWTNVTGGSGATSATYTTPGLTATTYYRAVVTSGTCSSANSTTTSVTVNALPTITGTTSASICGTGTATLGATASAGTINWYAVSTGGSILGSGTSFTTPVLSSTTTYYAEASANGCISANRAAITATVNPLPTVSSAVVSPAAVCVSGQVVFSATPSAGTITWYDATTNGNVVNVINPTISTTTTYYAEASSNGCTSATRTAVTATVNPLPTVNSASVIPATVCVSGQVVFSATPSAGTITWYDAATNGIVVNVLNPTISSSTTYYAEASSNGCTSAIRTAVTATVNALPAVSSASAIPATVCVSGQVVFSATPSAGTITWYDTATNGTVVNVLNPTISSTTTYYAEASANGCVSATRTAVTATIYPLPTVSSASVSPAAVCGSGQVLFSATPSAGTITWYDAATNGNFADDLNPAINKTTTYYAEASANGCLSASRTAVTATVNPLPTIVGTLNVCIGSTTQLTGSGTPATPLAWVSASPGIATVDNSGLVTGVSAGTSMITYTDIIGCTSSALVTINPKPQAVSGADRTIFAGQSTTLGATAVSGSSYSWISNPIGFTSSSANPTVTPAITTTYTVEETSDKGCKSTHNVTVTVKDNLSISKIVTTTPQKPGDNLSYQITYNNLSTSGAAQNITITDQLPPADFFTYISASNGGIFDNSKRTVIWNLPSIPGNTSGVLTINGRVGRTGWTDYKLDSYYQSVGSSTNNITNNAEIDNPTIEPIQITSPVITPITQFCNFEQQPIALSGWIKQSSPAYIYYLITITNTGNITDKFSFTKQDITPDQKNLLFSFILDLNGTAISGTPWLLPNESYTFMIRFETPNGTNTGINYTNITTTSTVCQLTKIYPIITNIGKDPVNSPDLQITKTATPSPVIVGEELTYNITVINANARNAMNPSISDLLPANVDYISSSGIGATPNYNIATRTITAVYHGNFTSEDPPIVITVKVRPNCSAMPSLQNTAEVSTSSSDNNPLNDIYTVTTIVNSDITAPTITGQAICAGATATLTASGAAAGYNYKWYDSAIGGNLLFTGNPYTTSILTTSTTYYVSLFKTADPVCESSRTAVIVTVFEIPSIINPPKPATVCEGTGSVFSADASGTDLSYQWEISANAGANWTELTNIAPYSGTSTPSLNISATTISMNGNQFRIKVRSSVCNWLASTQATLTVNPSPTITGNLIFCAGTTTQLTGSGTPATPLAWVSASTSVATVNNSGLVTGLSAGTSVITYTDINGCTGSATVTVNALPVITSQPTNQLDCEGHIVSFNVVATGSGLTYTWQRKKPSGSFADIPLTGEPNVSYPSPGTIRLENVGNTDAPDGTQYQVIITNSDNCSITSNSATLSVNEITGITPISTNVTICQGQNYSYQVTANYPSNVVSYQWKKWNNPGQWDYVIDGGPISGSTTDHLVFTGATPLESGKYKVTVVFHSSGADCNVTSDTRDRTLNVNPTPSCSITGSGSVYAGSTGNIYTSTPDPSDNVNHLWSISGNGTISGSNTGSTVNINATTIGSFTLTDDISRFGCTSSCSYVVSVIDLPCSITPTASVPNGTSTTYSAPAGMDSYAWSVTGNGSIPSAITNQQTVTVLAGNSCNTYTLTLHMTKSGASSTCSQTITVTDNLPPTFTPEGPFWFCVENLFTATYVSNDIIINPDPDYYLFKAGNTSLDLDPSKYIDNCCVVPTDPFTIRWEIVFISGEPTISGTGQPSTYSVGGIPTNIKLWGDGVTFNSRIHKIRYWLKDCNGNEVVTPIEQTITIKPRPSFN